MKVYLLRPNVSLSDYLAEQIAEGVAKKTVKKLGVKYPEIIYVLGSQYILYGVGKADYPGRYKVNAVVYRTREGGQLGYLICYLRGIPLGIPRRRNIVIPGTISSFFPSTANWWKMTQPTSFKAIDASISEPLFSGVYVDPLEEDDE